MNIFSLFINLLRHRLLTKQTISSLACETDFIEFSMQLSINTFYQATLRGPLTKQTLNQSGFIEAAVEIGQTEATYTKSCLVWLQLRPLHCWSSSLSMEYLGC